jgi:Domain of unknown function (DUF4397)
VRLLRHLARLSTAAVLLGCSAALVAGASTAASAAPLAAQDGWVRIAHLSPEAPAMDIYLYPFGDPAHPTVLKDVSYGDVSSYMALGPGQYTVAMRGFGAPSSSHPALVSSFMVGNGGSSYTVAALGPDPGLRVEVLQDKMTPPSGKAFVRVVQASLKRDQVTVSYGSHVLAKQLSFSSVTPYTAVSPGVQTVRITASGGDATMAVRLTADSVHTIVVLDSSTGLKADDLTDAAGSQVMPKGGTATGLGGTAPRPPANPAVWLLLIVAGILVAAAGGTGLARPRRGGVTAR